LGLGESRDVLLKIRAVMVVEDGCDETEELFCIAAEKMEKN